MSTPHTITQLAVQSAPRAQDNLDDEETLRSLSNSSNFIKKSLWILAIGFGGFLAWASYAPLDEGIPANGTVTIDTKRRPVQHHTGGIVKEVLIREGQVVQQGQVLMRLDEAVVRANFEQVRQRYYGLNATHSRLKAEQDNAERISFSDEVLKAAAKDPNLAQQLNNQKQLFEMRRQALRADVQVMQESIDGVKAQLEANKLVLAQRKQQLALIQDELVSLKSLVKDGYAPSNRLKELERSEADSKSLIADSTGQGMRNERTVAEFNQRIVARRSEYRKEVENQIIEVMQQLQADTEKYSAEKSNLQRIDLVAPASGQVVGLTVPTSGAVIGPGQKLMDIVPERQVLLLEAAIAPHLIDKVHTGLLADIRFNTFSQSPQLVVEGKVLSVSGDLIVDPNQPQSAHYLARLEVTSQGMKALGSRQLQPGMPAEVIVKTGERSLLTYLLDPLLKRLATSMKES